MNYEYTLHRIAKSDLNDCDYFAMRNGDGEAFNLYDEDDMRAVYTMLRDYFEKGIISDEPVEIEEVEGHWKQTWQAVKLAREYGVPEGRTDEQIAGTIRTAARKGRIKGAHQTLDGSEWWYSQRGLEDYLSRMTWRERRPLPKDSKIEFIMPDEPHGSGGRMLSESLENGNEISHKVNGIYYTLFLNDKDEICAVIDKEYYRLMNLPLPGEPKEVIVKPDDRKAANIILKRYGYRWEKFYREWLEDNDDFDREPGWYLFHGTGKATRELGRGDMAVDQAFDEINRGVDVVLGEMKEAARIERQRQHEAEERQRAIATIEKQIIKSGECPKECAYPEGETLFDTGNIYGTGECFVIASDYIWYIRNNGMDGDDWSRNNLPGAIAWRIPYDESVASKLRSLV